MKIEYFSKGGQFPYQAEGKIDKYYFYFRARHDIISLELFLNTKDLEKLENIVLSKVINSNSFLTDEEAEEHIFNLFNQIINLK